MEPVDPKTILGASIYDDPNPTATTTAHNANSIGLIRPIPASKSATSVFRSRPQSSLNLPKLVSEKHQELYFSKSLPKRDFFDDFATIGVAVLKQSIDVELLVFRSVLRVHSLYNSRRARLNEH